MLMTLIKLGTGLEIGWGILVMAVGKWVSQSLSAFESRLSMLMRWVMLLLGCEVMIWIDGLFLVKKLRLHFMLILLTHW